jgi:phosphatidylserine/phosphatidylglycerophosphate/cardiolipin synthase-like enzyme
MQSLFSAQQLGLDPGKLKVVHARYQESRPFSFDLFEGFTSLRVLTYSVSIPMTIKMLNLFESVECVFGYEGILHDFGTILACQKELSQNILMAAKGLDDERQMLLLELEKVAVGHVRFYVVKDAVAHSKIYLLEGSGRRRVIVGSANPSDRAFSGKQAETLVVFDDDEGAWDHYLDEYEAIRQDATSELVLPVLTRSEVSLEDVPLLQQASTTLRCYGLRQY